MIRFLFLCILVTFPADASTSFSPPPDIKPPLNTLPSLHLFPLRGELLHIYEGHISVRAVLVEHVTMKYRYAARYTEFVKQRKERILSALLVPRSSLRRNGKRDGERWQPLDSRPAVPGWAAFCPLTPSPPLVCSLSACNVYLPTFRGDTFPTRWLQLTATSDLINNPGGAHIKCFARATRLKVKFNFWPLPEPEGASGANSLASREIPVRQLMADIHQTRSWSCSHGVNEPYEHGDGYRLACEQR